MILVVAEDDNVNLVTVWVVVSAVFDYQAGHGWYGAHCVAFASEAMILFSADQGLDVLIDKALIFFLVDI